MENQKTNNYNVELAYKNLEDIISVHIIFATVTNLHK